MVQEIFSLKKNRYSIDDWLNFKQIAGYFSQIKSLQTGKTKTMYYIKVISTKSVWKDIFAKGTQFDYVPGGANNKIIWNKIKVENFSIKDRIELNYPKGFPYH